jgi:hypothetical protein
MARLWFIQDTLGRRRPRDNGRIGAGGSYNLMKVAFDADLGEISARGRLGSNYPFSDRTNLY